MLFSEEMSFLHPAGYSSTSSTYDQKYSCIQSTVPIRSELVRQEIGQKPGFPRDRFRPNTERVRFRRDDGRMQKKKNTMEEIRIKRKKKSLGGPQLATRRRTTSCGRVAADRARRVTGPRGAFATSAQPIPVSPVQCNEWRGRGGGMVMVRAKTRLLPGDESEIGLSRCHEEESRDRTKDGHLWVRDRFEYPPPSRCG